MLRPGTVMCSVLPRRAIVGLFAAFASVALVPSGVARAATVTSDFEPPAFQAGPVNGQNGWMSGPNVDEAVVSSGGIPTFGQQSLRMSNEFANSSFTGTQTYSTPVVPAAGETLPNTVYIAKFSIFDPTFQDGLYVTVSPDSGDGSRMAWVGLKDTSAGIEVTASDSPEVNGEFQDYPLGVLSHAQPHTIEFRIKLNPGKDNDLVRILIDGQDVGKCFTTWENYYRVASEQAGPPNNGEPPNINSLQFRVSAPTFHESGAGYLFDNVTVTTGTGPASPGCDVTIDKQADAPTVTAGGLEGYQVTVRNRGRLAARNLLLCDHIPSHTTFVSANRKLRRIGRRRCLMISRLGPGQHAGFHIELRVDADTPPGNLANIADITPVPPPDVPVVPPALKVDLPPGAATTPLTPIQKVKVVVKILRAKRTPRPPAPPPVTG